MAAKVQESPLARMVNIDVIKKMTVEPLEKKRDDYKDKVEIANKKVADQKQLKGLMLSYMGSLKSLGDPISNAFEQKTANISTNDNGIGSDYFDVLVESGALKGNFQVSVEQIAKPAKMLLQANGGGGFDETTPGLNGALTLTLGTDARNITITNADSAKAIIDKINNTFQKNNDNFEALLIKDPSTNKVFIEIKGKDGEAKSIAQAWTNDAIAPGAKSVAPLSTTASQKARVNVDGVAIESDSNELKGILPGVTLQLKKENNNPGAGFRSQTVNISEDPNKFVTSLSDVVEGYNKLALFIAEQDQELEVDIEDDSNITKFPPLHNSEELRTAKAALERFSNAYFGKSLETFGIGLSPAQGENDPAGAMTLQVKNPVLYNNSLKDISSLRQFFTNNSKVVADPTNAGATLMFTNLSKPLNANAHNKDFAVNVTIDEHSKVTGATVSFDGGVTTIPATIKESAGFTYFSFPASSNLDGVELAVKTNGVVSAPGGTITEKYTVNLTNGVANMALYKSEDVISEDGTRGILVKSSEEASKRLKSQMDELKKIEQEVSKSTKEAEAILMQVTMMDTMASMMDDMIQNMLFGDN